MATKNPDFNTLNEHGSYYKTIEGKLTRKITDFKRSHPEKPIHVLGYGDTSQPLPPVIVQALVDAAKRLGDENTYTGYEDGAGMPILRERLCTQYYQKQWGVVIDASEIFITEGAHTVCGTIHELFGRNNTAAFQNPAYPVFVEANLLSGRKNILFLPCTETTNFIPDVPSQPVDLIYLCFPNNPTGAVINREQLTRFVDYAQAHKAVIIFDAVYSMFIRGPGVPHSIYEIAGAKECAVEIGSFSKMANFTGLRVGWCIIPHALTIKDTSPGELNDLWWLRQSIKGWGIANLPQHGAIAALSEPGLQACRRNCDYYLENARILRGAFEQLGFTCFGGTDIPFIWLKAPSGMNAWQFFDYLLVKTGLVGFPGSLLGSAGDGYIRFSTLGSRQELEAAVHALYASSAA